MAINLTEDINHSGGGKIVSVAQSAGSWQSLATKSDFDNFTSDTTTKQNLTNGQFFYVLDESQLYKLTVAGFGPFATYTLASASFGDSIDTGSFLTAADTGSFLTSADTASFLTSDDTGSFLTALDTGSFLTSEDTSSFVLVSETSSMSVATASFIDPTFISASAAASGFGGGGSIPSGTISSSQQITDFGFISSSIDTSSFVLVSETGSFLTAEDTSSFVLVSETGSFLTAEDTSSFVLVSETSSMSVATASYVDPTFISASAAASGFGSGGSSGVGGIFIQTGSFYATTNDLQVTGSMTIGNGSLILNEYNSLPSVDRGGIIFSNGAFYIGVD